MQRDHFVYVTFKFTLSCVYTLGKCYVCLLEYYKENETIASNQIKLCTTVHTTPAEHIQTKTYKIQTKIRKTNILTMDFELLKMLYTNIPTPATTSQLINKRSEVNRKIYEKYIFHFVPSAQNHGFM